MTQLANHYAQALYDLVKDEADTKQILDQLEALDQAFTQEPAFLGLLRTPELSKPERCGILDDSFRGKVHPYLLNFLKLLTEKGPISCFHDCCKAYRQQYYLDNGILPVQAVTAVPMTQEQTEKLTAKLSEMTGKTVALSCKTDPDVLGGVCLNYDGKQVDGTVKSRLDAVRKLLKNTQL